MNDCASGFVHDSHTPTSQTQCVHDGTASDNETAPMTQTQETEPQIPPTNHTSLHKTMLTIYHLLVYFQ